MASESERCAHLIKVDRCSLVREDVGYNGGDVLEMIPDVGGEYNLLVPNR